MPSKVISFRVDESLDRDILEFINSLNSNNKSETIKSTIRRGIDEKSSPVSVMRVKLTIQDKKLIEWLNQFEYEERSELVTNILKAYMISQAIPSPINLDQPIIKQGSSQKLSDSSIDTSDAPSIMCSETEIEIDREELNERLDNLIDSF